MQELETVRGKITTGGNPLNFIELYDGTLVDISLNEPDPNTHRGDYYYNSRLNKLYRKLLTKENKYVWKHLIS